jgi:hypothetical protein
MVVVCEVVDDACEADDASGLEVLVYLFGTVPLVRDECAAEAVRERVGGSLGAQARMVADVGRYREESSCRRL